MQAQCGLACSGVAVDKVRAAQLYEQACSAKTGKACMYFADLLRDGAGIPHDPARAHEYYKQACALGETQACAQ